MFWVSVYSPVISSGTKAGDLRRRNLDALKGLFVQILRLCQKAGMVNLGHVALDSTKVKANASKHRAMSHERMLRAEKQLAQEINALMSKAEILVAQEDRRYGKTNRGSDLTDELRRLQARMERIRQARKEIKAEPEMGALYWTDMAPDIVACSREEQGSISV